MTSGGSSSQAVGSVTFIDSSIVNTPIGILTSHDSAASTFSNGSLILENVSFKNVGTAVQGPKNATALAGTSGSMKIAAWGQGHQYTPTGPSSFQGIIPGFPRPKGLSAGNVYYQRSKPSYATVPVSQFLSTRSLGAKGDGITDDTNTLQHAINAASLSGQILFFDAGTYRITKTLHVPGSLKMVGESYPVIMSSGPFFAKMDHPRPVVQVGRPGEVGNVEWSDMIISTQGPQAGAVLIEWNLASLKDRSGMWDVHTRIGGFAGSKLQNADCPAPINSPGNSLSEIQLLLAGTPRRPGQHTTVAQMLLRPASEHSCQCTSPNRQQDCIWKTYGSGPQTTTSTPLSPSPQIQTSRYTQDGAYTLKVKGVTSGCKSLPLPPYIYCRVP